MLHTLRVCTVKSLNMECLLHETTDWNSPFLMFPKSKWRFPYACDASPLNAILTHTEMNGEAQNFGCDVALSPPLKNICKTLVTVIQHLDVDA